MQRTFISAAIVTTLVAAAPARADTIDDLIAAFQRVSNERTPYGVTDGNPQAVTAVMSTDAFDRFGLLPALSLEPVTPANDFSFDLSLSGGTINTAPADSWFASSNLFFGWRFNDDVALAISVPLLVRNTKGLEAYEAGLTIGLPIVLAQDTGAGWAWQVTPWITPFAVAAANDLGQGGYIFGGGVTSSLHYRVGALRLILANQVNYMGGTPIGYRETFSFEQNISQPVVKNGVRAIYDVGRDFYVDAGATYTVLMQDAFVDNYWTPMVGVGVRFGPHAELDVRYRGDFGTDYEAHGAEVTLRFKM